MPSVIATEITYPRQGDAIYVFHRPMSKSGAVDTNIFPSPSQ